MPEDDMWVKLRENCEHLKSLAINLHVATLNRSSSLFDFEDLRSFSIRGLDDKNINHTPQVVDLPEKMWRMLLLRCPELEELQLASLNSWSGDLLNFDRALCGTWPRLRSLKLECFNRVTGQSMHASNIGDAGHSFFLRHSSSIENLTVGWRPQQNALALPPLALPHLRCFTASTIQLGVAELHESCFESLQELNLNNEYAHDVFDPPCLGPLCLLLGRLRKLRYLTLGIKYIEDDNPTHLEGFRLLLEACRGIDELTLISYVPSHDPEDARSMYGLLDLLNICTNLRQFVFHACYSPLHGTAFRTAQRLFLANSNLCGVSLQLSNSVSLGCVKIAGSYEVLPYNALAGTLQPDGDTNGRRAPVYILAHEWGPDMDDERYIRELFDSPDTEI